MIKVFNLGFPKTGTTSLIHAMKILGYKNSMFPEHIDKNEFNCFIGDPCVFANYQELDKNHDIRFLMTIRKDAETWFNSVSKWSLRPENQYELIKSQRQKMYGHRMPQNHKEDFIKVYNNRYIEVMNYFKKKSNLLVLCFEKNDGWYELCTYLNKKIPNVKFPHLNKQK